MIKITPGMVAKYQNETEISYWLFNKDRNARLLKVTGIDLMVNKVYNTTIHQNNGKG